MYTMPSYTLSYGITIWGSASNTLLIPLHTLQKKFVQLATFNDTYPVYPLTDTPPPPPPIIS